MQVGEEDAVDSLRGRARGFKPGRQPSISLETVDRLEFSVVLTSRTGLDYRPTVRSIDQQTVHPEPDPIAVIGRESLLP
jgi:hypothetical protein